MKTNRRLNWMVNKELQESLSRRLLVYWCGTWLAIFAIPTFMQLAFSSAPLSNVANKLVNDMWFPMLMSLLVLPIVFWDSIRFSHRIAGPVKRIGNDLRRFTDGETVHPIQLRHNDFCNELADNVNRLMKTHPLDNSDNSESNADKELETSGV